MHEPMGGSQWDAAERAERNDLLESLRLSYDLLESLPLYVAMPFQVASYAHGRCSMRALLRSTCELDAWPLHQLKNVRQQSPPPACILSLPACTHEATCRQACCALEFNGRLCSGILAVAGRVVVPRRLGRRTVCKGPSSSSSTKGAPTALERTLRLCLCATYAR